MIVHLREPHRRLDRARPDPPEGFFRALRARGLRAPPPARFGSPSAQSLNQIAKAYGENNSILDNCHVRVAFSTNDERTARRISDSLGTATEMRAMKNYAGHRLSPWLGHLMVSRQETARPLLTPGEVMQLPADEAIVQVSGVAPIRAKKARYYVDRELAARIAPPPDKPAILLPAEVSEWVSTIVAKSAPEKGHGDVDDEGGLKIEPELDPPETIIPVEPAEVELDLDLESDDGVQAEQSRRFRAAARIAALDPDDGIPL
jgi:type IV secretion system protein VirD4